MIDVTFDPPEGSPAGPVVRETLEGRREDGTPASTSLEAVDMHVVQYGPAGDVVAEGDYSDGAPSIVLRKREPEDR